MPDHPYRQLYVLDEIEPKTYKKPQEIIKAAKKAIRHFSKSCPLKGRATVVGVYKNGKSHPSSPHGPIYTIGPAGAQTIICCQKERQALKDLFQLNKFWRFIANFMLKNEKIYFKLIQDDDELVKYLLPKAPPMYSPKKKKVNHKDFVYFYYGETTWNKFGSMFDVGCVFK